MWIYWNKQQLEGSERVAQMLKSFSNVYQVKEFTAAIPKPDIDLPLSGQYQVTARITQQDTEIGCVQLAITVQELTKKTINDSKIQQKDRKVIYNWQFWNKKSIGDSFYFRPTKRT